MTYQSEILLRIRDSDQWPSFDRVNFLNELLEIADESYAKNSVEGYLASLLIYHQVCEEMVRLLLRDCQFFIQLSVFPSEIIFQERRRAMFGQIIEELKTTVSFNHKEEFITLCTELNKARIDIVHRLTKQSSIVEMQSQLICVQELSYRIFDLFEYIHDEFRVAFKDFRKDVFIDYSVEEFE